MSECINCPYHTTVYSEEIKEYVHACTYISKTTAWACVKEEKQDEKF